MRILVASSSRRLCRTLSALLALWGHKVWEAGGSAPVLSLALKFTADLVVLDLGDSEEEGLRLAREIRTHPTLAGAVLVALRGEGGEARARILLAGFDYCLGKPFHPDQLKELMASAALLGRGGSAPLPADFARMDRTIENLHREAARLRSSLARLEELRVASRAALRASRQAREAFRAGTLPSLQQRGSARGCEA